MKYINKCKTHLQSILNFPYKRSAKVTNGFILFLVLLSIALLPLHFLGIPPANYEKFLFLEKLIVTIFSFEYIIRIWVSPAPLRYIFSIRGVIDLLAILPFYLSLFIPLDHPEIFVAFRALRLFKFDEVFACYNTSHHPDKKEMLHRSISIFPGEHVEQVIQRHPMIFILFCVPPLFFLFVSGFLFFALPFSWVILALGLFSFLGAVVAFLKNWIDQNYDIMLVTNLRVVFQERELFGARSNAVAYTAIHNVMCDNIGFLRWVFDYGHITIETANRDATLDFSYAPHPNVVVDQISHHLQR